MNAQNPALPLNIDISGWRQNRMARSQAAYDMAAEAAKVAVAEFGQQNESLLKYAAGLEPDRATAAMEGAMAADPSLRDSLGTLRNTLKQTMLAAHEAAENAVLGDKPDKADKVMEDFRVLYRDGGGADWLPAIGYHHKENWGAVAQDINNQITSRAMLRRSRQDNGLEEGLSPAL